MFGDATRVGHKCKKARPTSMLREKSECRPAVSEPNQPEVHQWRDIKVRKEVPAAGMRNSTSNARWLPALLERADASAKRSATASCMSGLNPSSSCAAETCNHSCPPSAPPD